MPPTIVPTGDQGIMLVGSGYLLASTATFQSLTSSASAIAAFNNRVHFDADDTEDTLALRPRAIVDFGNNYNRRVEGVAPQAMDGSIVISLELPLSQAVEDSENRWDWIIEACNHIDAIIAEMLALKGTGNGYVTGQTHVNVVDIRAMHPPVLVTWTGTVEGEEQRVVFYGTNLECVLKG